MKKTFKGSRNKVIEEVVDYLSNLEIDVEKEISEVFVVSIDENRTLLQNNLIHQSLRLLGDEMGEDNIEKLKMDLKEQMGLYTDYTVDTHNGRCINREFKSTSNFSKKELSAFYDYVCRQAMENFNLDINGILGFNDTAIDPTINQNFIYKK